jgi:hypothetical protein
MVAGVGEIATPAFFRALILSSALPVCTGEGELQSALKSIPNAWKDRVAMMQNELLPRDWATHNFINPTVITSSKVSPMVAGVGEIATPAFFRALILSSALPEPPLITAPACFEMKKPIIVLGIGELGSVFARAFLKNNRPVYPITRATDIDELRSLIDPEGLAK